VVRRLKVAGQGIISGRQTPAATAAPVQRRTTMPDMSFIDRADFDLEPTSPLESFRSRWDAEAVTAAAMAPPTGPQMSLCSLCSHRVLNEPSSLKSGLTGCFSLRFSPDDSELAAGFFDGSLRVYDLNAMDRGSSKDQVFEWHVSKAAGLSESEAEPAPKRMDAGITNLRWYPSEEMAMIATVDTSGATHIWADKSRFPKAWRHVAEIPGKACLNALAFSVDGSRLLVGGSERVIQVYDVTADKSSFASALSSVLGDGAAAPGRITRHNLKVRCLSSDPTNKNLFVSGGLDQHVLIWDLRAGKDAVGVIAGAQISGDAVEISSDGSTVLTGSHRPSKPLQVHDIRTCQVIANYDWGGAVDTSSAAVTSGLHLRRRPSLDAYGYETMSCSVSTASWSSENNKIVVAAGECENQARVFQKSVAKAPKPLKIVGTLDGEHGSFWASAVSSDGRCVAFGDSSGAVYVAEVAGAMIY